MYLSSLTLRGFKSFAAATTFRFEPGITCVVGPNGSGKSNVVDAIAWVLGEHSAKSLRGGAMSDVIFAGTPGKAPLGRAEVTLTIDNSDGALPIAHREVSVSRLLFRSGDSEYAINGTPCRLLDVQELLSDSGIGRELHVIVGQGQLDAVLQARPEDRRAYIEEAAGVLKHRKRKEKALRKLEGMQAGLTRLTDLSGELRRQLGPLGRQADVARRAGSIQAALRDARLRLLAEDILTARQALEAERRDEEVVRARQQAAAAAVDAAATEEERVTEELAAQSPRAARAQEVFYRLTALQERLRGTRTLAAERARLLAEPVEAAAPGQDPEALEREAVTVRAEETAQRASLAQAQQALTAVTGRRTALEGALAAADKAVLAAARAAADRREGLARLAGQAAALRSRAAAAEEEIGRLSAGLDSAASRQARAQADTDALVLEVGGLDEGEADLDTRHEAAAAVQTVADERLAALQAQEREAERARSAAVARRDALALPLRRRDGAAALLDGAGGPGAGGPGADGPGADGAPSEDGVLGAVSALLDVEPGASVAVAAALGPAADAVAVAGPDAAVAVLRRLDGADSGRVGLLLAGPGLDGAGPIDGSGPRGAVPAQPPAGGRWLLDAVRPPAALAPAVTALLGGVVLVPDLAAAAEVVTADPSLRAVTPTGDLLGVHWALGGAGGAPSQLEVQAAHDEAAVAAEMAAHDGERLRFALAAAAEEAGAAAAEVTAALELLDEHDARLGAAHERLALLGAQARSAAGEAERLGRSREQAEQARDRALAQLAELEERLALAARDDRGEATGGDARQVQPDAVERDRVAAACVAVRAEEVEARLALRTAEERTAHLAARAQALERAAAAERAGREQTARARAARQEGRRVATAVAEVAERAVELTGRAVVTAGVDREASAAARTGLEGDLLAARTRVREATTELDGLRDALHRDEVARAEQRLRLEALTTRAVEEHATPVEELLASYSPGVEVPGEPDEAGRPGPARPYDRGDQERRAAAAERQLALLGRVNPLALEEYDALQERQAFLATQLSDLQSTRRDLLGIVRDVDERIHEVFAAAFADTAREFATVFATLFPGGEGHLVLTDPDDIAASGVEVEARPPGKRVKRLSLLSGGERSLTAIALLLAIFRARPSPFYVLDEVEAALDDRNLQRLLEALEGLREQAQLIIITHQKRTMEVADALYGVAMRGDGVSTVISQRLRDTEPSPA